MEKEITKKQSCVKTQSGAEIWIDEDKVKELLTEINKGSNLILLKDNWINPRGIEILTAQEMENITRRKNGQWFCKHGCWHEKGAKCECWMKNRSLAELAQG